MSRGRRSQTAQPIDESPSGSFLADLVEVLRDQNRAQGEQMREMFQANGHSNEGRSQPVYKQFMSFKPAEFKGSTDPMVAEEWMQSMATIFDFMQCIDADRIRCATFMFKDGARIWWQSAKTAMDLEAASWE